jgi:hypothetical protein
MTDLIKHILATYTLWFVVTQSPVIPGWTQFRDAMTRKSEGFARFMLCPMCSGFWCSAIIGVLPYIPQAPAGVAAFLSCAVTVLAGATGVFLIETLVSRLQAR